MMKIFRSDYEIVERGNMLFLQSLVMADASFAISAVEAFYLMQYDGNASQMEVQSLCHELFGQKWTALERMDDFLLPRETASRYLLHQRNGTDASVFLSGKFSVPTMQERNRPRNLILFLTNRCNRKCMYCYAFQYQSEIDYIDEELSLEVYQDIVDQAFLLGIKSVLLTGGEPFVYENTEQIIRYCTERDMEVQVLTKDRLDPARVGGVDYSRFRIEFSIDSHLKDVADRITGEDGFYDDIHYNMSLMNRWGKPFIISMVINKWNENHIWDSIQYYFDHGASRVRTTHYEPSGPRGEALYVDTDRKRELDEQMKQYLQDRPAIQSRVEHKQHTARAISSCESVRKTICIGATGRYSICYRMVNEKDVAMGSICSQTLIEHWVSSERRTTMYPARELYSGQQCGSCERFEHCEGRTSCLYKSYQQNGTVYSPTLNL